ncbi:hypothetical protein BYT27DRAFT_7336386 [Phlegmacium glaucopus]|nr:hypothetical protein BYT27DRAFT_7336386 [Phlegmacium glaucopus]
MKKNYEDLTYEVVSSVFRALAGKKMIGSASYKANFEANQGDPFSIERYIFLRLPTSHCDRDQRHPPSDHLFSGCWCRPFDLKIVTKSGPEDDFISINRDVFEGLISEECHQFWSMKVWTKEGFGQDKVEKPAKKKVAVSVADSDADEDDGKAKKSSDNDAMDVDEDGSKADKPTPRPKPKLETSASVPSSSIKPKLTSKTTKNDEEDQVDVEAEVVQVEPPKKKLEKTD